MPKQVWKKVCFVIGPIGKHKSRERKHADLLLKKIIRPTFSNHFKTYKVERADHITRPGMIDSQVITHLIEADLVIADITGRNANAFYELGIRHMLQKPVIHLFRRGDPIPADIAPYRAIEFDYKNAVDVREAKITLRKMVTEVTLPIFVVENPVTRSTGFIRMQNATQDQPPPAKRYRLSLGQPVRSLHQAPGVSWTRKDKYYLATWKPSPKFVRHGFRSRPMFLWRGTKDKLSDVARHFITDTANALQDEMLVWGQDHFIFDPTL